MRRIAFAISFVACFFGLVAVGTHMFPDPPPVSASVGTVERRIHLKMEGPYDSDKPRAFVCRELP
jgi:hypothetical protein